VVFENFFIIRQPVVGQVLLIVKASRSHLYTPHSVELPCMSDQADSETFT